MDARKGEFAVKMWRSPLCDHPVQTIKPPHDFDPSNCKIEAEISDNGKLFFITYTTEKSQPRRTKIKVFAIIGNGKNETIQEVKLLSLQQEEKLYKKGEQGTGSFYRNTVAISPPTHFW